MKHYLKIGGRLFLTAGAIAAIGWGFVALNPPDENGAVVGVQKSNADIFTMSFGERSSTQKFSAALDRLGHEKPRVYDYNGNTVMFSTNQLRGSLDQVFDQYMRAFAEEDLNPHVFRKDEEPGSKAYDAMMDAAVSGGIVPWVHDDKYMSMGGAVLDVKISNPEVKRSRIELQNEEMDVLLERFEQAYKQCGGGEEEFRAAMKNPQPKSTVGARKKVEDTLERMCAGGGDAGGLCDTATYRSKVLEKKHKGMIQLIEDNPALEECGPVRDAISSISGHHYDDFTKRVKAFRSIEAWHNEQTGVTKVTATWSDESFDMTKTQPSRYGQVADNEAAKKIPLCPGCRRTWAFQGTGKERAYSSNMIISTSDIARTKAFYAIELDKQGWQIPESEAVVNEMDRLAGVARQGDQWLRMQRDDEFLHLHFSRDEKGRTRVRTTVAP